MMPILRTTRVLESQIYGVSSLDPVAFLLPSAGLSVAGLLACLLPGSRAASADPVQLLQDPG